MIGQTIAQYHIISELGRGGMGVVYRAMDTELKRDVALKVMSALELASDEAKARFRQEAQAATQLNNPNVATIYQIGEDAGKLFIAMEYIEGKTLEELIGSDLSPDNALRLGAQLADGLAAAHARNIVHRDIKPANVMVDSSGRLKILDFGLAKMDASPNLTVEGVTVGTYAYMSPEQIRGEEAGVASDMWSFGVLLHEMLAGERPFSAAYDAALSFQILNEDPAELDDLVPKEVRAGVSALLTKDASLRLLDAREFLAEHAPSGSFSTVSRPAAPSSGTPAWQKPAMIGIGVVIVALLAWVLLPGGSDTPPQQDGIAVFPFNVSGSEELVDFGDGFARLLTDRLDESGAVRTVEYNGLKGLVDRRGGLVATPEDARALASEFNSEGYVFGNVLEVPGSIVISASLFGAGGNEDATAQITISEESEILQAVDDLGRQLLASKYGESGDELTRAAVLTTKSYPALKLYLRGMDHLRSTDFHEAYTSFQEATEIDSTFAMAWYGMGRTSEWGNNPRDPEHKSYNRALTFSDRLPLRLRDRIDALKAFRDADAEEALRLFGRATTAYPDDADAWALRGDVAYHFNRLLGRPMSEAVEYMQRAIEIDPGNQEMNSHLRGILLDMGDVEGFALLSQKPFDAPAWTEWIPALLTDSLGMQSPAFDSLSNSDQWFFMPLFAHLFFLEDPWLAESSIEALSPDKRALMGPASSLIQVTTGRVRRAWEGWGPVLQDNPEIPLLTLALSPSLYEPHQDVLDEAWKDYLAPALARGIEAETEERKQGLLYHTGVLALMRQDDDAVDDVISRLQSDTTVVATTLVNLLQSRRSLYEGRFQEALRLADSAFFNAAMRFRDQAAGFSWPFQARWLRTEALFRLGEYSRVIRWIDALGDGGLSGDDGTDGQLMSMKWAASAFMRGKSNMALQRYDEAEKDFARFIYLFREADEEYQHLVGDAREELDRIAEIRTREPSS